MRQLSDVTRATLQGVQTIIAANRGPFVLDSVNPADVRGAAVRQSEGGGLLTAMLSLADATDATWVASAVGTGDRELARRARRGRIVAPNGRGYKMSYVEAPPAAYEAYYTVIANPLLWFVQHHLWDLARTPLITDQTMVAWRDGYVDVNRRFADAVIAAAATSARPPVVMIQDYHFYLAPAMIRAARPDAVIQHFVHIPWPDPTQWRILPKEMRDGIVAGLLGNDIVGFQTPRDAWNFRNACVEFAGATIEGNDVVYDGRRILVRDYPISIDTDALRALAADPRTIAHRQEIQSWRPQRMVLKIDRLDLSKNHIRAVLAFERFLELHPEERGVTQFVAFVQPTRSDIPEYANYAAAVAGEIARINARPDLRGPRGELPIHYETGQDATRVAALFAEYDALLVNSVNDGMHLIAKEGPILNERNGPVVLSETVGAYPELAVHALGVNPYFIDECARALHQALTMPAIEKSVRADGLRAQVTTHDLPAWLEAMVADIAVVLSGRGIAGPTTPGRGLA